MCGAMLVASCSTQSSSASCSVAWHLQHAVQSHCWSQKCIETAEKDHVQATQVSRLPAGNMVLCVQDIGTTHNRGQHINTSN